MTNAFTGIEKQKRLPVGKRRSYQTSPPMARARRRAIGRPRPMPEEERESPLDSCSKCSKMLVGGAVGNPGPVVGDDQDVLLSVGEALHQHLIATVLPGILEKVANHLLDPLRIGLHPDSDRQRNRPLPTAPGREQHVGDIVDQLPQVEHLGMEAEPTRLQTGDHQHVFNQIPEVLGLLVDVPEELVHLRGFELLATSSPGFRRSRRSKSKESATRGSPLPRSRS